MSRTRIRIWLASAMWIPVLATNVVAIALALGLPLLDERMARDERLPLSVSSAQQIFGALAAGMITFTGIIFSAVFVAAQIQTSSYSPRLAARLRRDPVVIAGLALPTATATYALFALAAIGRQTGTGDDQLVPVLTVVFGLALLVVTLGAFVALVQRAFDMTQVGGILRVLMRRGYAVIDDVHPVDAPTGTAPSDPAAEAVLHDGPPAVIAAIDREALLRLARATGGFVEVAPRVGEYLAPGATTVRVHGARERPEIAAARRVLVLSRQRTIDQDPAFVIRILVDIAIRGLSPAVNDPTTATQALDRIETLLVELHRRHPGATLVVDEQGTPRGCVPGPSWTEYFELAVTEIRRYGAGSVQTTRRLHALYERLLAVTGADERTRVLTERRLLDEAMRHHFGDAGEREIATRPDRMGLGGSATSAAGDAAGGAAGDSA
jgi:uncharacterized membrane protein